jgi:hypothetical protein
LLQPFSFLIKIDGLTSYNLRAPTALPMRLSTA